MMAETPDTMRDVRIDQQETAQALAELLGLDLPSVCWSISDLEWHRRELKGTIFRYSTPQEFDQAAQEAALNEWAAHFGVTVLPRHPTMPENSSRQIEFSFYDVHVTIYTTVPAGAAEVEPEGPEAAA